MNRLKMGLIVCSLTAFGWAQAAQQSTTSPTGQQAPQTQQPGSQQIPGSSSSTPTPSQPGQASTGSTSQAGASPTASNISGCMQQSWGRYLVTDSASNTTYDVKGSGTKLSDHANHVVQVKGLPDTKSARGDTVPFYVQQVQDSGQSCGNAAAAANPSAPGQMGTQGATANQTTSVGSATSTPGAQAPAGTQQGGVSVNQKPAQSGSNPTPPTGAAPNPQSQPPQGATSNPQTQTPR
jgi:hypothetical protein